MLLLAGTCIGYAVFIKKNSMIFFPGFFAYFAYLTLSCMRDARKKKQIPLNLVYFFLPIIFLFILVAIQNKVLYGAISNTEYGDLKKTISYLSMGDPIKGLYYYLVSSGKGFLIYNCAIMLGLLSVRDLFRKDKKFFLLIALLFIFTLGFYSYIFFRGSLFSWGPRWLFPMLPLFAILFAEFLSKTKSYIRKIIVLFFAIAGFLIQLPTIVINFSRYLFFVKERLGLPEYLIDFMPELSPIRGTWALMLSFFSRHISGGSLYYTYNPDCFFVTPVSASMQLYDIADIWFVNMLKASPSLLIAVLIAIILLIFIALISSMKLKKIIFSK